MVEPTAQLTISPTNTALLRSIELYRTVNSLWFKALSFLAWVLGLGSLACIAAFYSKSVDLDNPALFLILFGLFSFYFALRLYYKSTVFGEETGENGSSSPKGNLFELFNFDLGIATADLFSKNQNLTARELSISMLDTTDLTFMLARLGIGKEKLFNLLKEYRSEKRADEIILEALEVAASHKRDKIRPGDVFLALCKADKLFAKIIFDLKLEPADIENLAYWCEKVIDHSTKRSFFSKETFKLSGGIGKDWAYGYTPFLKHFSYDITREIESGNVHLEIIGHDKEIEDIKEALLRRNGGNAIVVGEPGVGKETTILGFAKKVAEGKTNSALDFKHILKVDAETLLSGSSSMGDVAQRLQGILNEASFAGNVILYFENFGNLLSSSGEVGKVDATQVILPFLESPDTHVIGTCDVKSFNQYISSDTALNEHFVRVSIDEPADSDLVKIIEDVVPAIEYRTGSFISYEAIKETVNASHDYIMDIPNPEKSINLLDSATAHASSERGKTIILPKDILEYVSDKYRIPVSELNETEKSKLLVLEKLMHERVIGQNEAISAISNALRRARAGVSSSNKPIGSFLFLGPTGVGKTETCKALAEAYFGGENKMIRFDMSEYQNSEDIYRLIGDSQSESGQGELTTAVRENPFSLILFDELEKASKDILDLFLQILDEGHVTEGSGKKVIFKNTIIIATSNAGANLIRESVQSGVEYEKVQKGLINYLQKEGIYKPEFLNRFSGLVVFSPLSLEETQQVAAIMIKNLQSTLLKNKGVTVSIAPEAVSLLAQKGYDPEMGARPMARIIQEKIENLLANKILSGELKKGDSITLGPNEIA